MYKPILIEEKFQKAQNTFFWALKCSYFIHLFLATKSHFQCTKKWTRRTRQALRSINSNFEYHYQPENPQKEKRVISTLKIKVISWFVTLIFGSHVDM